MERREQLELPVRLDPRVQQDYPDQLVPRVQWEPVVGSEPPEFLELLELLELADQLETLERQDQLVRQDLQDNKAQLERLADQVTLGHWDLLEQLE